MVRTHLVRIFFDPKFLKIRINSFRPKWKNHLVRKKRTTKNDSFCPMFIFLSEFFSLVWKIYFFNRNFKFVYKNYVWSKNLPYASVQKSYLLWDLKENRLFYMDLNHMLSYIAIQRQTPAQQLGFQGWGISYLLMLPSILSVESDMASG